MNWWLFVLIVAQIVAAFWLGYRFGRTAERAADAVHKATKEEAEWEERKP